MRIDAKGLDDATRQRSEPTIALINIVFLMLIFFLVAAQISPPLERDLDLISTQDLAGDEPPDALVISAEGELSYRGATVTPAQYVTIRQETVPELDALRLVPDRDLAATQLIEIGGQLQALGVKRIFIVTERSLGET